MSFLRTLLMVVFIPFSMMSTSDSICRTCERTGAQLPKSIEQYYAPKILRDITTSDLKKVFWW